MLRTLQRAILLVVALLPAVAAAHEGHHHTAMGTIDVVDAERISLAMKDGETHSFVLTEETVFTRGPVIVPREDATPGERAVVMYETKGESDLVIEVKLPPRTD